MIDQIKIGVWNINGLGKDSEKLNDEEFRHIMEDFDIFSLIETWHTSSSRISLRGFTSFQQIRKKKHKRGRNSGGLIIYIKNNIKDGISHLTSNVPDSSWLKLKKSFFGLEKDIFICITYRKPSSVKGCHDYFSVLENEMSKYAALGNVCISGDFNARTAVKPDFIAPDKITDSISNMFEDKVCNQIRNNLDMKTNAAGLQLLNLCKITDSLILNGRVIGNLTGHYTYIAKNGCSVVDYTIVDNYLFEKIIYQTIDLPSHISDHCLQHFSIKCDYTHSTKTKAQNKISPFQSKFKWDVDAREKYPLSLLDKEITNKITEFQFKQFSEDEQGVNEATEALTNIMVQAGKLSLRQSSCTKTQKRRNKWFDRDCKTQKRIFNQLKKDLKRDPKNPFLRGKICRERKLYKKLIRFKKQQEKDHLIAQLSVLQTTNPKLYWNIIDKLKGENNKESLANDIDPDEWIAYYKKLSLQSFSDDSLKEEISKLENHNAEAELNQPITISEIKKCIRRLKNNKACGDDLIMNEMLKSGSNILLPSISKLFNLILRNQKFPSNWNINIQSMIYKSGNHLDCNNYRGISITSCLGKLFTSVLQSRLLEFLEENNKLSDKQAAFRPGFSTTDHLFTLRSIVNKYIKASKGKLYVCFVDFHKAFDKVWRDGLFLKL